MTRESEPVQNLADLLPKDAFIGTSLILRADSRFLFGLRPLKRDAAGPILELTGIGGKLEPQDPTTIAGVQREAQEEIGRSVRLLSCPQTLIVRGYDQLEFVRLTGPEQPAAVVFRYHRTPAHNPWHAQNQGLTCLVVYLGELIDEPTPTPEIPHLLWLPARLILETARRDVALGELLLEGATLVRGPQELPSLKVPVRLTDSQEALAIALGDWTIDFYHGLPDLPEKVCADILAAAAAGLYEPGDQLLDESWSTSSWADSADHLTGELQATTAALDHARQELAAAREQIQALTERAVRAETELRLLKENQAFPPASPTMPGSPPTPVESTQIEPTSADSTGESPEPTPDTSEQASQERSALSRFWHWFVDYRDRETGQTVPKPKNTRFWAPTRAEQLGQADDEE